MSHYDYDKIKNKLKKKVSESRYTHTIGVAYTATSLAMVHAPSDESEEYIEKALTAGLLHDYAKCIDDEEMLKKCIKKDIPISESEKKSPLLLHGKLAAYYAERDFGVEDSDILEAIKWHTTGKPNMSLIGKIIFVADYIEPGRDKQPNLSYIRKLAFSDIDKCVYQIADDTLNYLCGRKKLIDEMTVKTRDFYYDLIKNREV